jgi:hypothetical protein
MLWTQPLIVGAEPKTVHLGLHEADEGIIDFEIYADFDTVHCEGRALIRPTETAADSLDVEAIKARCTEVQTFRAETRLGTIQQIFSGKAEALGELVLPATEAGYALNPALLDGAFHVGVGIPQEEPTGAPRLLFAIDRVEILRNTTPHMWSWVRSNPESTAAVTKVDIDLADESGAICIRFVGVSSRARAAIGASSSSDVSVRETEVRAPEIHDAGSSDSLHQKAVAYFKSLLGDALKVAPEEIDAGEALERYGIDSVAILNLTTLLKRTIPTISSTVFFDNRSVNDLVAHFMKKDLGSLQTLVGSDSGQETSEGGSRVMPARTSSARDRRRQRRARSLSQPRAADRDSGRIAIIGLSGRYPQAPTLREFWQNLKEGKDCISEIPPGRWPLKNFYCPDPNEALLTGRSYGKWGGFVPGFADFDCLFFGISPREATSIDPQERLFLQTCWEVVEDAGYTRDTLASRHGGRVGVFAGITRTGYELFGPELWKRGESVYPRTSFSSLANRVSYHLNLNGPSMPIDTMCSASLTAIHEACG